MTAESPRQLGYLTDNQGNPSSMRLMSMFSFWVAAFLAVFPMIATLFGAKATPMEPGSVLIFLIGAFAPKAIQKFAENKSPITSEGTR